MNQLEINLHSPSEDVFLAEMCKNNTHTSFVFIMEDTTTLDYLAKTIQFFDDTRPVLIFPSWDSEMGDALAPSIHIMARRLKSLLHLAKINRPYALLTSISAVTQKVLPKKTVLSLPIYLQCSMSLRMDSLVKILLAYEYTQSSLVKEIGNFAVRENIIDIFQPTSQYPTRIYFNDDCIEYIKSFEPNTQLTTGEDLRNLVVYPATEFIKHGKSSLSFEEKHISDASAPFKQLNLKHESIDLEPKESDFANIFDYVPKATLVFNKTTLSDIAKYMQNISDRLGSPDHNSNKLFMDIGEYKKITSKFSRIVLNKTDAQESVVLQKADNISLPPLKRTLESEDPPLGIQKTFAFVGYDHTQHGAVPPKKNNIYVPHIKYVLNSDFPLFDIQKTCVFAAIAQYIGTLGNRILFVCYSEESVTYFEEKFKEYDINLTRVREYKHINDSQSIAILPISCSVSTPDLTIITEKDLLGKECDLRTIPYTITAEEHDFTIGDVVVHRDYGVGIFNALKTLAVCGKSHDFVEILYKNNDKLFVPVEDMYLVTKYGNNFDIVLDKLHGTSWKEKKSKLEARINEIAQTLINTDAARKLSVGSKFFADQKYIDFCKECPYVETQDQLKAIANVEEDLASGSVMDRLICGDVGFGKTEIALRAAFLVVNEDISNQVAVIVPTTLLCNQHLASFKKRFKNHPVNIRALSRTASGTRAQVKEGIADGSVNIVVGTSALLADSISFLNLRLLIIDEEQHFGVQQKEKLRTFKTDLHVLSLSATPIPRTLHMSLSGIKNLSILRTPPLGRKPVKLSVIKHFDDIAIKTAILHEVHRGGRVFFTCPLISDIDKVHRRLCKLVPDVKITVAHGKMSSTTLDKIMNHFLEGEFLVLLTTSIIESGIDIPIANTIIVYNADMFGLAQLYQLKGRVGRSTINGHAYFVLSEKISANSPGMKRVETVKSLHSIGSGFSLAIQDMDMRGFGNLVGEEQSGNIKEIGMELYHKMLEEAIESLGSNGTTRASTHTVKVDLFKHVRIPESYVAELDVRMQVYKKISLLKTEDDVDDYTSELIDRFGTPPPEVQNLLNVIRIKRICSIIGISEVSYDPTKHSVVLLMEVDLVLQEGIIGYFVGNPKIFSIYDKRIEMYVPQIKRHVVAEYVVSVLKPAIRCMSDNTHYNNLV